MAKIEISANTEVSTIQPANGLRGKADNIDASFKGNLRQAANEEKFLNRWKAGSSHDQDRRVGFDRNTPDAKMKILISSKHSQNEIDCQTQKDVSRSLTTLDRMDAANTRLLIQGEFSSSTRLQWRQNSSTEVAGETEGEKRQPNPEKIEPVTSIMPQLSVSPAVEPLEAAAEQPPFIVEPRMSEKASIDNSQIELQLKAKSGLQIARIAPTLDTDTIPESNPAETSGAEFRLLEAQFQKFHGALDRQRISIAAGMVPYEAEAGTFQINSASKTNLALYTSVEKLSLKLFTNNDAYITCDIQKSDGNLEIILAAAGSEYERIRGHENELKRTLSSMGVPVDEVKFQLVRPADRHEPTDMAASGSAIDHGSDDAMNDARRNPNNSIHVAAKNRRDRHAISAETNLPVSDRSSGIYI